MEITNYDLLKKIYIKGKRRDEIRIALGVTSKEFRKKERKAIKWIIKEYGGKAR